MTEAEKALLPEFRAEAARSLAVEAPRRACDSELRHYIAAAIREAVRQDRKEVDELLAQRLEKDCFCHKDDMPCEACLEVARIRGALSARPER